MMMKKWNGLFLLLLLVSSCQQKDFDIVNLNDNQITALGHGGMGIGQVYPLNSFESVLNCLNLGAAGTELDVQMTKDSVLVLFHSESLEHTTNLSGQIFTKNWDEIKEAAYNDLPYTEYRLITLDQLFSNITDPQQYTFFLDCKNFNPDTSAFYLNTFNNALIKIIEKHQLENAVYIELKRLDLIQSLKHKRPEYNIFLYAGFEYAIPIIRQYDLQGIVIAVDNISSEEVLQAHEAGIMVAVFNAHSNGRNIDAIEKNVDFIQSDRIKHLIRLLD